MKTNRPRTSAKLIVVMATVELLAAVILCYLAWATFGGEGGVAGCGDAGTIDCDHVLASRWSRWLFVPVAMPALLLYAAMFTATLLAGPWSRVSTQRRAWWSLVAMTTLAALVALWFIFLQAAVLGAFCVYCMAAHTCSLVLFGLVVCGGPQQWPRLPPSISVAQLLGLSEAARAAKISRAEMSLAGAWKGYRRGLLTGVAAAVAIIAIQVLLAPASFTVTAEEGFLDSPPQDKLIAGVRGDGQSASPAVAATDVGPVGQQRPGGELTDGALPTPAAAEKEAAAISAAPTPTPVDVTEPDGAAAATITQTPAAPSRTLTLLGGKVSLQVDQQMLLGSPSAEMLLVTLFDYTCPHCRAMHFQLRAAREHYGDRLAVILIPVPLNVGCNSAIDATFPQHDYACHYARLALAVWKHNRAAFPEFHDWLFQPLDAPPPGVARSRAAKLVTDQPLNEAILDPWVDKRLHACVELYRRYNAGRIPKIVMAGRLITGDIERRKDLYDLIDAAFGRAVSR